MRRFALALVLVAACGGSRGSGPAWPKSADYVPDYTSEDEQWKEDGGESIDPHESKATTVEGSGDSGDADWADFSSYDFTPDESTVIIESAPPPATDSDGATDDAPPPPPP